MAVRSTLELGDPLLRQPAQPVGNIGSAATLAAIADLWDTLDDIRQRHTWVRALAAPTIGIDLRIAVLHVREQRLVLINPRFEAWSSQVVAAWESCITFNMLWGEVYRPARVVVVAEDEAGRTQRYEADGLLARVMQHEIDHLDGLVWLDRDPDLTTLCTVNEYMRRAIQLPPRRTDDGR
jgi:peptide deformylase